MMSTLQLRQSGSDRPQLNVNVSEVRGSLQPRALNGGMNSGQSGNQRLNQPSQNSVLSLRTANKGWEQNPFGIAHNYENAVWFGHREVSGGKNACGRVNFFLFFFILSHKHTQTQKVHKEKQK